MRKVVPDESLRLIRPTACTLVGPVSEAPPGKTARSNQRNTISSASTTTAPMLIEATYQRR